MLASALNLNFFASSAAFPLRPLRFKAFAFSLEENQALIAKFAKEKPPEDAKKFKFVLVNILLPAKNSARPAL